LSIQSGFAQKDSSKILKDSTLIPTPISYSKDAPDTSIVYKAADSMLFDVSSNQIYLWNEASIDYKELQLKAYKIGINWQEHILSADQELDSNVTEIGRPHFTQDGQTMEARRMLYNYETKKGKIYELLSKEDQGIIHSSEVKRIDDSSYFSKKAVYTTCDAPHPHFGFEASKMKVVPNKLIVAGPTHLVISNIPTPLVLPFAIFPISKEQSSGLILPAPGQDLAKGFFLRHGGYYFALGHHHDMALT
jgi:lipopolysaccharide assembly outer membrane protein LptD (OstA)